MKAFSKIRTPLKITYLIVVVEELKLINRNKEVSSITEPNFFFIILNYILLLIFCLGYVHHFD